MFCVEFCPAVIHGELVGDSGLVLTGCQTFLLETENLVFLLGIRDMELKFLLEPHIVNLLAREGWWRQLLEMGGGGGGVSFHVGVGIIDLGVVLELSLDVSPVSVNDPLGVAPLLLGGVGGDVRADLRVGVVGRPPELLRLLEQFLHPGVSPRSRSWIVMGQFLHLFLKESQILFVSLKDF